MSNHFNAAGQAHIVDVSEKAQTVRIAVATAIIRLLPGAADQVRGGSAKKGDVLGVARLAAIGGAKLTGQLIPLCHPILIEAVQVDFDWPDADDVSTGRRDAPDGRVPLRCTVTVRTTGKTGVEMEALTAASAGCLTVYDMLKSVDREMVIGPIKLVSKRGGKSGDFDAA